MRVGPKAGKRPAARPGAATAAGFRIVPVPLTAREVAILARHGWCERGADARAIGRALRDVLAFLGPPEDWPRRYGAGWR